MPIVWDLSVGTVFPSMEEGRKAVLETSVAKGESFRVFKADSRAWIVVCKDKDCVFRIRLSYGKALVKITVRREHTCSPITHQGWRAASSVAVLAGHHRGAVVDDRGVKPKQLQHTERREHGNQISYHQAWRTRTALREELEGDEEESFKRFPALRAAMLAAGDGTYCEVDVKEEQFHRFFVAPASCRLAWSHCRPLLALDGTFLKGRCRMTLLAAVTLDGDNKTLPLAWGLVPKESLDDWTWFLYQLSQAFPSMRDPPTVILSDRDKGLEGAVAIHLPEAEHGHCCQHLADNVQKHHGLACRKLFWMAARTTTQSAFNEVLNKIREEKEECFTYLEGIPPGRWATWAFAQRRYGHDTSNMVESMNAEWLPTRDLPPLLVMIDIWTRTMQRFHTRLHQQYSSLYWSDYLVKEVNKGYQEARPLRLVASSPYVAQVFLSTGTSHIVNWLERTCTCLAFQDKRLPCPHAIAMARDAQLDPYNVVSPAYTINVLRSTYLTPLHPIQAEILPTDEGCKAPDIRVRRGRRRTQRIRWDRPNSRPYRCGQCNELGHSRQHCTSTN